MGPEEVVVVVQWVWSFPFAGWKSSGGNGCTMCLFLIPLKMVNKVISIFYDAHYQERLKY